MDGIDSETNLQRLRLSAIQPASRQLQFNAIIFQMRKSK